MNYRTPPPITPATPIRVWPPAIKGGSVLVELGNDMWTIEVWPDGTARVGGFDIQPHQLADIVADCRRMLDTATAVHAGTWQA